jgi:homopolymeric O-antigen transport system ATP-binding protein
MSDAIIKVQDLGKCYRIRHQANGQRYVALRDVIAEKAKNLLRRNGVASQPSREDFWALRNVSFEVRQGEVLGIIGRNGAGKTTLLKILSRITEPTEGCVRIKGRVASLLEVGTGFHPELTGRENIYLNGAILGMSKSEIRKKFDEIVAFAETEKFLDTPVKRYSSGMYVRLAFAVAAHLEPEILVVDEVLAVGDVEFQKKCLGKMQEVSRGGRTVLFVSHNMAAIKSLTTRGLVLDSGQIAFLGPVAEAVDNYTARITAKKQSDEGKARGRGTHTTLIDAALLDRAGRECGEYVPGEPMRLRVIVETDGTTNLSLDGFLLDQSRAKLGYFSEHHFRGRLLPNRAGRYVYEIELPALWLASGSYSFDLTTAIPNVTWDHYVEDMVSFDVLSCNPAGLPYDFKHHYGYGPLALQPTNNSRCEPSAENVSSQFPTAVTS